MKLGKLNLLKGVFDELRDNPEQERTLGLQARVGVDLNQTELEVLIDHEVIAQHLEGVREPPRIQLEACRPERVCDELLHLRHNVLDHIHLQVPVVLVQIPLEVAVAHLVVIFELTEVLALLLNGVIRQVNELVAEVVQVEFAT
jgi:hypothetical protein